MTRRANTNLVLTLVAAFTLSVCAPPKKEAPKVTEILWDTWGVPHLYGKSNEELFHAFGWAQMKSHGDLILDLYGQARGRAAEYWDEDRLDSDRWVRTMGIYKRAGEWYKAQSPEFHRYIEAFAEGMNRYAEEHPEKISEEALRVLPVSPIDVMAHTQRVMHFYFVGSSDAIVQADQVLQGDKGSNAWAIAPSRSETGNAMLLANPHLAWSGAQMFYEVHLIGPGIDFYGATLVGFPVLALGFSEHLGWSHTVNTFDGADSYKLVLEDEGYRFDDEILPFETEEQTLRVRQEDGSFQNELLTIRHSVHGPVIFEKGDEAVAYRVVGLGEPAMLEQWWEMTRATNLEEFESALKRLQVPMFNVIYADRDGHILYLFNGQVPKRSGGSFMSWYGIVPGHLSRNLWNDIHPYTDLPRLVDPETGWLQNANDPPWTTTYPEAFDRHDFPIYMAPRFMHFRAQQSANLLIQDESISFEELIDYKHSTRMLLADRLLDDLLPAAREHGDDVAQAAADVLEKWDRCTDADSKGAVLFERWAQKLNLETIFFDPSGEEMSRVFEVVWDPKSPHTTPDGLSDPVQAAKLLAEAATGLEEEYGSTSVAWGDVYRLKYGDKDLPANGGPGDPTGVFRTAYFTPGEDGTFDIMAGDTFYAVVEFSRPIKARVLTSYGNSTQPDSPHKGDQLELFSRKEMRTPWLTREEIEINLESRTSFKK